jgi:hypothetical protein
MAFWILVRLRRMAEREGRRSTSGTRLSGSCALHGRVARTNHAGSRADPPEHWRVRPFTPPGPPLCKVGKAFGDHAKTKPIRQVAGANAKPYRESVLDEILKRTGLDNVARFSKRTHSRSLSGWADWIGGNGSRWTGELRSRGRRGRSARGGCAKHLSGGRGRRVAIRAVRGVFGPDSEPGMAGAARRHHAKTKPIRKVASRERKALAGMGPRRISKTNPRLTTWQGFRNGATRRTDDGGRRTGAGRDQDMGFKPGPGHRWRAGYFGVAGRIGTRGQFVCEL